MLSYFIERCWDNVSVKYNKIITIQIHSEYKQGKMAIKLLFMDFMDF